MVPRLFRLRQDQDQALRKLPGNDSEHIRQALDDYIQKIKNSNISASASKQEGSNV